MNQNHNQHAISAFVVKMKQNMLLATIHKRFKVTSAGINNDINEAADNLYKKAHKQNTKDAVFHPHM